MMNDPLQLPVLLDSSVVFEERIIKIRRDKLQVDQKPPYHYYTLVTPPTAVLILPLTPEGSYVLTEEYRHPTGRILLGCPGGFIDPSEDPVQAAQRELLEETGYQARSFTVMGSAFPYAGFSGQKTLFIKALDAVYMTRSNLEASEIIRTRLFTPEALKMEIKSGVDIDGTLCTALYFNSNFQSNRNISEA